MQMVPHGLNCWHLYPEMAFILSFSSCRRYQLGRTPQNCKQRRLSKQVSNTRLALSKPERESQRSNRFGERKPSDWPSKVPSPEENEYDSWSSDFLQLCNTQLSLLMSTISNLYQVALFFRHENQETGALEFVPLIVHSRSTEEHPSRIWISSGAAGETELEDAQTSKVLPGGIPAEWILPDYPFQYIGEEGGIAMPDGGLCIPVEYNHVLAGSVVLVPDSCAVSNPIRDIWTPENIKRADMVAKSIALGAALEGKGQASATMLGSSRTTIDSIRNILLTTLHQVRSPVTALVTFGHLLLRKLPPGDSNRDLAKNMVLEALRIDDLLTPLDDAQDRLVLPEASHEKLPWYEQNEDITSVAIDDSSKESDVLTPAAAFMMGAADVSPEGKKLLWLTDVLQPQADIASLLATEKGISFESEIDDDCPAVMAVEKFVREAISNLFDNSLKYTPPGEHMGISCKTIYERKDDEVKEIVEVIVWDTGYGFSEDEKLSVWEFGYRGSAGQNDESSGSGIGLAVARELLSASGSEISMASPLPADLDPRGDIKGRKSTPGSAFIIRFERPPR